MVHGMCLFCLERVHPVWQAEKNNAYKNSKKSSDRGLLQGGFEIRESASFKFIFDVEIEKLRAVIIMLVERGIFLFSPTHKRTEGRAPVWGSDFTSKDAALHGGSSRNRCYAERKMWPDSVENPFCSTSGIFKPISVFCRSH
jgi:hypothetical protein